jgi:hypothetical protein
MNWSAESKLKIKTTKFYSLTKSVVDTCIQYEEHVERLCSDFAGKICSLREIHGLEPETPSERELKRKALNEVTLKNKNDLWTKFKVYDGNDTEMWSKATEFYNSVLGKGLNGKSKPEKKSDGFFYCSTTGHLDKQRNTDVKNMATQSWWSTFALLPNRLNYARVFVGYDNMEDPSDYTIYIKYAILVDTPANRDTINTYAKKTKRTNSVSSGDLLTDEDNSDEENYIL